MVEKFHVLIADEDSGLTNTLQQLLSANRSISSVTIFHTGTGLEDKIRQLKPDVVLLDLTLPGMDALSVLANLNSNPPAHRPAIFVISSFVSHETAAECSRLNVSFYLRKPLDFPFLISLITRYGKHRQDTRTESFPNDPLMTLAVTQLLSNYRFSSHMMGFRYVRDAVLLAFYDNTAVDSVTKILYPQIAKKYHTTWTSVERDIRTAIRNAWQRSGGNFPGFHKDSQPTSREFISTLSDRLRIEQQLGSTHFVIQA